QVCAQLCRRPCYCPWVPPRCPRGSPLVLDGCGSGGGTGVPKMLLSPCRGWSLGVLQGNFRQTSSSLKPLNGRVGVEASEEGCELNGRVYRDGEVFQPSCKLQCRCLDGGFTCVPLCQEDVR
ncbi:WNT1-inducible-signaling pathway protein 2, partial [Opisthocomus hoazin]